MNKLAILVMSILFLGPTGSKAQNISGIVNSYAAVKAISNTEISVSSATAFTSGDRILLIQMKGAVVDVSNTSAFGDIVSMGGAGTYEFLDVLSITGNTITTASAMSHTYNSASGFVQLVRVPKYCNAIVTGALSCAPWNTSAGTGGVLAIEADKLTLNSDINTNEKGFNGGNFAVSSFNCDNGNFKGAVGAGGGQKGESISTYTISASGLKGKQANGGGAANSGNSGGGGGANGGAGGFGGNQYSGCNSQMDERGVGALSLNSSLNTLFMGGGGGGGFEDNGLVATKGGNGGGIIYIKANVIISNNRTISSNGGSVTILADAEGAGGGGGGGSVFLACTNINGNISVQTNGGNGGSNNNTMFLVECHGTGGGGGGGVFAFSGPIMPSNITYSPLGGAAGTINNSSSACFATTNGATNGTNGVAIPNLPATPLAFSEPTLSIQSNTLICRGETTSITVSGATDYHWNNGSSTAVLVVSPTVTTSYTVTGSALNSCEKSLSTSITVSLCTGINSFVNAQDLKMYPNPVNGKLFFETSKFTHVEIYDETGKLLSEYGFDAGVNTIDMLHYPAGIYHVKANDGSGPRVSKLVKIE